MRTVKFLALVFGLAVFAMLSNRYRDNFTEAHSFSKFHEHGEKTQLEKKTGDGGKFGNFDDGGGE
ncbi:MAG: hypothetical protein LRY73_10030 [Bacillus sp. (in: Bacteria)]|nr:hypothetical protein [Bacillus sp. (in: firmicutes)]